MSNLGDFLQNLTEKVAEVDGALEIMELANSGEISVEEATVRLTNLIVGSGIEKELTQQVSIISEEMGANMDDLVFQHDNGTYMWNPLIEAKIAERLSIDGDIPELRRDALPPEGSPAVPVLTHSLNPLYVGHLLEQASNTVSEYLLEAKEEYSRRCEENTYLIPPSLPLDMPGCYERGKSPPLMKVEPTASLAELENFPVSKKKELVYKSFATTQGRNSFVLPIKEQIIKELVKGGVERFSGGDKEFSNSWVVQTWGPDDIQENFNPAMTAATSMVENFLGECKPFSVSFDVQPINGYSDRIFGWKCTFNYSEGL